MSIQNVWLRRLAVLFEVVAVFFAGTLAARALLNALGIQGSKAAIQASTLTSFDAWAVALPMSIRWTIVLTLAFVVGGFIARHGLRDYGVTLAGHPLLWHVKIGIATYVIAGTPALVVMLLRHFLQLSGGPAVWDVIDQASWRSRDFWMFMLASSIVLPPLFEELFFRGYALKRVGTVFKPVTAAILIAVLFMLAHTQYLDGSIVGVMMFATGIWMISILGIVRLRTGSLTAPIVAHALSNVPLTPAFRLILLPPLLILGAYTLHRAIRGSTGKGRFSLASYVNEPAMS